MIHCCTARIYSAFVDVPCERSSFNGMSRPQSHDHSIRNMPLFLIGEHPLSTLLFIEGSTSQPISTSASAVAAAAAHKLAVLFTV